MPVKWVQLLYDFFKDPPEWFEDICEGIGRIVFSLIKGVGENYIRQIESKVIEISKTYSSASGDEKFNLVWDFAHTLLPSWKESDLDTIIQNIYIWLKKKNKV